MKRLPDYLVRQGLAVSASLGAAQSSVQSALAMHEAFLAQLEAHEEAEPTPSTPADPSYLPFDGCTHPLELRTDTTTSGESERTFHCRGCRRASGELKNKGVS